jgi:hypothetical protein
MVSVPGDLRYWLNEDIEIGVKATGVGSALPPGTCVDLVNGVWVISDVDNLALRHGIIPNLAPLNTDSDDTLQVVTGEGAEIYTTLNGTCAKGQGLAGDDGGKAKAVTTGHWMSYVGHDGENLGGLDDTITDGADEDTICVRLGQ